MTTTTTTTTRTLAAYGLAATMIGGSLFGAATVLTGDGSGPPSNVQIVQATDTEPGSGATAATQGPEPAQTAPPLAEPLEAANPPSAASMTESAGAMAGDEPGDADHGDAEYDDDRDEGDDED